eukprot:5288718-Prymnesium_polylepis.1
MCRRCWRPLRRRRRRAWRRRRCSRRMRRCAARQSMRWRRHRPETLWMSIWRAGVGRGAGDSRGGWRTTKGAGARAWASGRSARGPGS